MQGWYQVAFERDISGDLTATHVGCRRLMLVRHGGNLRAFDAYCPHRGAHLAYGGRLEGAELVCPFHGYRIALGNDGRTRLAVREHRLASIGGMIFVRLSPERDNGWAEYLANLQREHFIINGFEMTVCTSMETVIENAFDRRHFQSVHGVRTDEFVVRPDPSGALIVESTFYVPTRESATGRYFPVAAPYRAFVASPGLTAVELRGRVPYTVITGATNAPDGGCIIRISLAFPHSVWQNGPPAHVSQELLHHSRRGLEEDRVMWENLCRSFRPQWMPEDHTSLKFFEFCEAHHDACE
jgi:3-ketosteroid 9alpha-monooxygenase subunit A